MAKGGNGGFGGGMAQGARSRMPTTSIFGGAGAGGNYSAYAGLGQTSGGGIMQQAPPQHGQRQQQGGSIYGGGLMGQIGSAQATQGAQNYQGGTNQSSFGGGNVMGGMAPGQTQGTFTNAQGQTQSALNAGSRTMGSVNWNAVAGIQNYLNTINPAQRQQAEQYLSAQGLMPSYNGMSLPQAQQAGSIQGMGQMGGSGSPYLGGMSSAGGNNGYLAQQHQNWQNDFSRQNTDGGGNVMLQNAGGVFLDSTGAGYTGVSGGQQYSNGRLVGPAGGGDTGLATSFAPMHSGGGLGASGASQAQRQGVGLSGRLYASPSAVATTGAFGDKLGGVGVGVGTGGGYPTTPQPSYPLEGRMEQAIGGVLDNPSPYSAEQTAMLRNRSTAGIDQQRMAAQQQAAQDAARRGLSPQEAAANQSALGASYDRTRQGVQQDFELNNALASRQGLMQGLGAAGSLLGQQTQAGQFGQSQAQQLGMFNQGQAQQYGMFGQSQAQQNQQFNQNLELQNEMSMRQYLAMLGQTQAGNPPLFVNSL